MSKNVIVIGFLLALVVNPAMAEWGKNNGLFDRAPQGLDTLMHRDSYAKANVLLADFANTGAMAQSDSGAWGFAEGASPEKLAESSALGWCQKYNQAFERAHPCKVIFSDGVWHRQPNKALGIIEGLPAWAPAEPIDPIEINDSAKLDKDDGKYALSLTKRLWLHHHGLSFDRSLYGVRLSFWLGYWKDLADEYPPAKVLMHYAAFNLEQRLLHTGLNRYERFDSFEDFSELKGFNRALKMESRTVSLVKTLESKYPGKLSIQVRSMRDALIKARDFDLLLKYTNPTLDYISMLDRHLRVMSGDSRRNGSLDETNRFTKEVASLIALLASAERHDEALDIINRAKFDIRDEVHLTILEQALLGKFPES